MATLIQSKQIQGVVTASVIQGDFTVGGGGSVNLSDASGVSGSFSGSYQGDGSLLTGISYSNLTNLPTLFSGSTQVDITQTDGFTAFSSSIATSLSSVDTDDQTLSFNQASKILTIGDGNSVDLSTLGGGGGGGSSIWTISSGVYKVSADLEVTGSITATSFTGSIDYSNLISVPSLISGSAQLFTDLDSRYELSGAGGGDVTHLNTFTSSIQTEVDAISATTSSYLTQTPAGTISGSSQVDYDVLTGGKGLLSGSHSDVGSLNTFTSSIQTEVDGLSSVTSSYLTSSGSVDYVDITSIPSGLISGSEQILGGTGILSGSHSDLSSLNTFTSSYSTDSSSFDTRISNIGDHANVEHINTFTSSASDRLLNIEAATGSYLTSETDSQTLSIDGNDLTISSGNTITIPGTTIPVGTISGSEQITDLGFISSSHSDVTNLNTFTSSIQTEVDAISSATSSYLTQTPSGTISGSEQVDFDVVTGGKGILSGSKTDIDSLNTFTSSIQTELDAISAATSSYLTSETDSQTLSISGDQLTISSGNVVTIPTGSELPSGLVSSSIQVLGGTGILSGSHSDVTHLNTFTSSVQTEIDGLSSVTSSYLTEIPAGTLSGSEQLPSGLVSSSVQVLGGTGILSGSHSDLTSLNAYTQSNDISISNIENTTSSLEQRVEQIESNTGSYDSQVLGLNDSLNTFSSSIQTEVDGLSTFTGSIQTELDALSAATSSYLTSETDSQTLSIDGNELTISSGNAITLPSTSIPSGTISGSSQLTSSYDNRYVINQAPTATFTNHTTNFNTNLATSGKTMVSMSVSDSESNSPFSASLSGTDGSSFDLVYSNAASSSIGIHAGSNLSAQTYSYNVSIFDSFGKSTTESRTLEVTQADTGTLNGDTTSYIIESANNGATIRDVSGFGGGNASQVSVSYSPNYGSQTLASFTSSNPAVLIDSSGNLTMGLALRGSSTGSGDTIVSNISFTDQYSNVGNSNVTINVFANNHPSASLSDISGDLNINEATSGTDLVNVTITDTESDTPFSSSLSGTHASSFQLQYNNSNSSSIDIQAASDLIAQTYSYTLDIFDNFGKTSSYARTLTIADSDVGTLGTNGTFYIIESATSGNTIRLNSNGRTGTQGDLTVSYSPNQGSQTCSEFTSSNALIAVNSSGNLSVGSNISGSSETSGDTITSNITFADQYGNVGSGSISVNVTTNNAPDIVFSNSSRLNTNQATGSSGTLTTLSFSDTESDSVDYANLSFTDSSGQLTATQNSNTWLVTANSQLSASNYTFSAAIEDEHHFRTNTESHTITIAQSVTGSLAGDTSVYIIESAESESVYRDASGFNNGNAAQVSVTYSPSHGSPVVQQYTSSREGVTIDSSGNLTAGYHFSGSVINTDYTSTAIATDSTNSTLYGKSLHSHGLKIVQGAAISDQSAVPDLFTEKVAQVVKLMITGSGADIDDVAQANMIGTLKGELGTWHQNLPTAQRVLRGAGTDYTTNPLNDSNYSSYSGLQSFQDSHSTKDMIWYLSSTAASGSGDADITEVVEHLMHTIHSYGVRGGVEGSVNGLSWIPGMDSDWKTRELFLAFKQAVDNSVFSLTDYGDEDYNTADTFELAVIEYLYLLNFNMWEYSSLWDSGSLSPEWNDNSRTPSGIQTNNALGYALYNKYIKPVLTKPSLSSLRSIFQDGDVGNPAIAGSSGYTPEVGSSLISKITFNDQYGNIGIGSVTATVFGNQAPAASFTATSNYESDNATNGSTAGTLSLSDTESDNPLVVTLSGTHASSFQVSGTNIQSNTTLSAGTYTINITVTDSYSESVTLSNQTITVTQSQDFGKIYIYYSNYGSDAGFSGNYNGLMGADTVNSDTPPEVTAYTGNTASPYYKFKAGDIGSTSISLAGSKNATLAAVVSGSNLNSAISASAAAMSWANGVQSLILFPSGSDMGGIPSSMTDGFGGSTTGQYVLVEYADGTSAPLGATNSMLHSIQLDSALHGYSEWFVLGAKAQNSASTMRLKVLAVSGSLGAF
tara:strand:+ start:4449 stop:10460 length:6012 start_codon:yes stop_codon:yes gene_type:complete